MTSTTRTNPYQEAAKKERDQTILAHMPLVKRIAHALGARVPRQVDASDLVSAGTVGLIRAVDRFDPGRAVAFDVYAGRCIRQSIFAFLRSLDPLPYSTRVKIRRVEEATIRLEANLERAPSEEEIAADLGVTESEVSNLLAQATSLALFALKDDGDRAHGTGGADQETDTVLDLIEREQVRELLVRRIAELPRSERTVLMLYYYERMKMKEIGDILGITESRVSQIHAKALTILRAHLRRTLET